MRQILIRTAIALIVLPPLWLFTARWVSGLIDNAFTVPLASLPASPVGWNGTWIQFGATIDGVDGPKNGWNAPDVRQGSHRLNLQGPGPEFKPQAELTVDSNNRLVLTASDQNIVLGIASGTIAGSDRPVPAYAADPGDVVSIAIERSWLSWPTPFETNWMTGYTHSWRRRLYYRLTWVKASGERLDMLWRFEQGFHKVDGWNAPGGPDDATGLIRVDIRPAR